MKLGLEVTFNSGEQVSITVLPPEWVKWETKTARRITDIKGDNLLGMTDLAFLAYHAIKREAAGKPSLPFDTWIETVADIDASPLNPKVTAADQSGG